MQINEKKLFKFLSFGQFLGYLEVLGNVKKYMDLIFDYRHCFSILPSILEDVILIISRLSQFTQVMVYC
jgi:hypothetical protein